MPNERGDQMSLGSETAWEKAENMSERGKIKELDGRFS